MNNNEDQKDSYCVPKIRICGPCGKTSCPLAHKFKTYIRSLEAYKKEDAIKASKMKHWNNKKKCSNVKNNLRHNMGPDKNGVDSKKTKVKSPDCTRIQIENISKDRKEIYDTTSTPMGSKSTIAYMCNLNKTQNYKGPMFGNDFVVESLTMNNVQKDEELMRAQRPTPAGKCHCRGLSIANLPDCITPARVTPQSTGVNTLIANNSENKNSGIKKYDVYNCLTIQDDTECKCSPPKPTPPCKTFDCDCIAEMGNIAARKHHRSYCPLFKHKSNCPVMMNKEVELEEEAEEEAVPLPYGLPPIRLGPCPVMGKPCAYPDGFAKMYKTAAQPALPRGYSDSGRVCCSKEYERIKKALTDYMRYEKDHDYRCINTFNVDTERRCCDKEQRLKSLMGKDCCGTHKLAIQDRYKQDKR